mgnify:CR=1 FL=1
MPCSFCGIVGHNRRTCQRFDLLAAAATEEQTNVETEDTTQSGSNATQDQVSQQAQTSAVPPVQASSELGGEEGSVVTQDNTGSVNSQTPKYGSGLQIDVQA